MTWAKFDDGYTDHPKVVALSDGAFRLHTSGIVYCARYMTDGFVPAPQVKNLVPVFRNAYLNELTRAGLWRREGGGFTIHDYLEWNRSRAQITKESSSKSEAGRKGAKKRWQKRDE